MTNEFPITWQWENHKIGGSDRNCIFGRFENGQKGIYSFIIKRKRTIPLAIIGERRTNNSNKITEKSAKISDKVTDLSTCSDFNIVALTLSKANL